jgi:hypothetical protein
VSLKKLKSGHPSQMGPDTKMNWPTDRRLQYNFDTQYTSALLLEVGHAWSRRRGIVDVSHPVTGIASLLFTLYMCISYGKVRSLGS